MDASEKLLDDLCQEVARLHAENSRLRCLLGIKFEEAHERMSKMQKCETCPRACYPSQLLEKRCIDCWHEAYQELLKDRPYSL